MSINNSGQIIFNLDVYCIYMIVYFKQRIDT